MRGNDAIVGDCILRIVVELDSAITVKHGKGIARMYTHTVDNEPYLNLWAAVVELAVNDILAIRHRRMNADQRESMMWVASPSNGPASFKWACDMLELNVRAVREKCGITREIEDEKGNRGNRGAVCRRPVRSDVLRVVARQRGVK